MLFLRRITAAAASHRRFNNNCFGVPPPSSQVAGNGARTGAAASAGCRIQGSCDSDNDRQCCRHRHHYRLSIQQQRQQQQRSFSIRHYHSTSRNEIFPLILATVVVGGGYYTYRALQRMNTEWEDYQWALQEYERQQLKNPHNNNNSTEQPLLPSVAIDLGTVFTKLATTHPTVQLAIAREGDRAFFNGIVYDNSNNNSNNQQSPPVQCRGRTALERFYFAKDSSSSSSATTTTPTVTLPSLAVMRLLHNDNDDNDTMAQQQEAEAQRIVSDVLQPALTEVLDRTATTTTTLTAHAEKIRKVITVPCSFLGNVALYQKAFAGVLGSGSSSSSSKTLSSFVPEPVAAVWGAQFHDILPDYTSLTAEQRRQQHQQRNQPPPLAREISTLVLDVGGYTTQVAVVRNDRVVHSTTLPFGGETVVEQLVELLLHQQQPQQLLHNDDTRALALLQMQARHAVTELAFQTRVHVHVPYVFANPQHHHLDARVARSVLEQAVQTHIRQQYQEHPQEQHDHHLSPHLPLPTDLTSLWTSVVTQVLEQSATLPTSLDHVLLVGGAAKMPLIQSTVGQALQQLMGSVAAGATTFFPTLDPTLRSELTVLGAATLLPSFDYSFENGLVRRE